MPETMALEPIEIEVTTDEKKIVLNERRLNVSPATNH